MWAGDFDRERGDIVMNNRAFWAYSMKPVDLDDEASLTRGLGVWRRITRAA